MSFKKNWFDYIIGTVISIVLCIILATFLNAQCVLYQIGKYETVFIVCVVFAGIYTIYKILHCCFEKWGSRLFQISGRSKMLWEIFCVLSLFSGAVLIRCYRYLYCFTELYGTKEFYEAAIIREGMEIPKMVHGASYLYTGVLSVIFSFLGNKQSAGIVLQAVLQLAGILFLYLAVRTLLGRAEAVISMAVMSFFPVSLQNGFTLTPQNLYFFLFAGIFFFLSCCRKALQAPQAGGCVKFLLPLLTGIFTGYMIYLDIAGTLLFIAAFYILLDRGEKKGNLPVAVILTAACLFSLFFLFLFQSFYHGEPLIQTVLAWLKLYFPPVFSYRIAAPDVTIAGSVAVCIGSAWYAIGFWSEKGARGSLYALSVLLLLLFVFFTEPVMDCSLLTLFYWSVLAAAGITGMSGWERREQSLPAHNSGNGQRKKKKKNRKKTEEKAEKETGREYGMEIEIKDMDDGENKNKIRFIENPLPLPKKHVKKTMGYRFEPEEEGMKYDIETKENDDFDLK